MEELSWKTVLYTFRTNVQNNEIQDVITRYGILCISKSYITENASSGDQLNRGVGR
jgi:hypothetical protein